MNERNTIIDSALIHINTAVINGNKCTSAVVDLNLTCPPSRKRAGKIITDPPL